MKRLGAVLEMAHNRRIDDFEDLVMLKGLGPKTLRSLALASEVIHGDSSRFDDPARFAFAVGGKDGRPFPVDTKALDETINVLQDSVEKSKLGYKDKYRMEPFRKKWWNDFYGKNNQRCYKRNNVTSKWNNVWKQSKKLKKDMTLLP